MHDVRTLKSKGDGIKRTAVGFQPHSTDEN